MPAEDIYVVGVGMTPFGKLWELSVKKLTQRAVTAALADSGCAQESIQAAFMAATTQGTLEGQTFIPGPIALRAMGFESIPMLTVENACASGSTAFWQAINFLRSGAGEVALAVGAEKMNVQDREKSLKLFDGGWDVTRVKESLEALGEKSADFEVPAGTTSADSYSAFMDVYAFMARAHMKAYGLTQRQIAAVSAKNHVHSVHNERAHFRRAFTIEDVLRAKPIVYPLTVPMCAPVTDGAAAAVLCTGSALGKYGIARSRAVKVLHCALGSGSTPAPNTSNAITKLAQRAYEIAGVGPRDVSVAEVHDATAFGEIKQSENLGLCPPGEGGACAECGDTQLGGRIPINPSGGLESKGHPLGATGLGQIFELVSQLRGECGPRQVPDARIALQENGGGLIGTDEAVFVVTLLGR